MKNLYSIATISILSMFIVCNQSCSKNDTTYNGTEIQFSVESTDHIISYGSEKKDTFLVEISIIGKPLSSNTELIIYPSFTEHQKYSSAISIAESIVIPANEYKTDLSIVFTTDSIKEKSHGSFALKLEGDHVSENYKEMTVTFYKQALIDVFSGEYNCYESEYDHTYGIEVLHTIPSSDTLLIKNFWDFTPENQFVKIILEDDFKISIIEQDFVDNESILYNLYGTGEYQPDGTFTLAYNLLKDGVLYESGKQAYTQK